MSDTSKAEVCYNAFLYEESDDDNEINPNLDIDPEDEDYEFEDLKDIEMDDNAWVLANLDKGKKETAMIVYNPEIQKLKDMAEQVKRARIKVETRQRYNNANVVYVSWTYHNFKDQFHEDVIKKAE